MFWAYNQGLEQGLEFGALDEDAKKDPSNAPGGLYAKRDQAAAVGSVVHDMVEDFIHFEDHERHNTYDPGSEEHELVTAGFESFMAWWNMSKPKIVATEMPFYSEAFRFGGTLDAVAEINGEIVMLDWKTSKGVYADYLLQIAAYGQLWFENRDQVIKGYHLCRFSKDNAGFTHHYWKDLSPAWNMFETLLKAYRMDIEVKKLL